MSKHEQYKMINEFTDMPIAYVLNPDDQTIKVVAKNGMVLIIEADMEYIDRWDCFTPILKYKIVDAFNINQEIKNE